MDKKLLPKELLERIGNGLLDTDTMIEDEIDFVMEDIEEDYDIDADLIEDLLLNIGIQQCAACGYWCKTSDLIEDKVGDHYCDTCWYDSDDSDYY